MAIWVSSLAQAPRLAKAVRPVRIVSLLSPYDDFPRFEDVDEGAHLRLPIHDIVDDIGDWKAPDMSDAAKLVAFLEQWETHAPLLVHCYAGISRSTATAFIGACMHAPSMDEEEIAWSIRTASPTASPNPRLVAHADAILDRGGRMRAAVTAIGRGLVSVEASPFKVPLDFAAGPAEGPAPA